MALSVFVVSLMIVQITAAEEDKGRWVKSDQPCMVDEECEGPSFSQPPNYMAWCYNYDEDYCCDTAPNSFCVSTYERRTRSRRNLLFGLSQEKELTAAPPPRPKCFCEKWVPDDPK